MRHKVCDKGARGSPDPTHLRLSRPERPSGADNTSHIQLQTFSPAPPKTKLRSDVCGGKFSLLAFEDPTFLSTLYVGGKGAGLKLSIATCGLRLHVWGLRSQPSLCHNHGAHGALARCCLWRNLWAVGGGGQASGHRQESPQERRQATQPPSSGRGPAPMQGVDVNGMLPSCSSRQGFGKNRSLVCSSTFAICTSIASL